jgi:translation initiation factor IF-1
MNEPGYTTGVIVAVRSMVDWAVVLDDGREVQARVPMAVARLMMNVVAGDRVRLELTGHRMPRVVGFDR